VLDEHCAIKRAGRSHRSISEVAVYWRQSEAANLSIRARQSHRVGDGEQQSRVKLVTK
jgi:hypothetical protein